jgi:hypothetical protein
MDHRIVRISALAAVLALASTTLAAQETRSPHDAQPERPTVATHAGTVAPGWLEIETGIERDDPDPGSASISTPTLLKLGVASHLQFDLSLLLIPSHVLGPVALDINVGYTRRSVSGDAANAMLWTVSTGTTVRGPWIIAAEVFGYPGFAGPGSVGFLAGPTYAVRRWLVVDAGFIARVSGPQSPALHAGLTWNIGRVW